MASTALAILAILAVGFLMVLITVFPSKARATETTEWKNWGVSPFAHSLTEACRKAPGAIDGLEMPPTAKEYFKKTLGTECNNGVEMWLTPGTVLGQMWTGGKTPHVLNNVRVGELPVLKSPEGRKYRKGAVAETAKAFMWDAIHADKEGKRTTLNLYLPMVCFNFSLVSKELPQIESSTPPPKEQKAQAEEKPAPLPPPPPPPPSNKECPNGWAIIVNVWSLSALPSDLQKETRKLIAAAESRDSQQATSVTAYYKADDLSRTLGARLRKEVKTRWVTANTNISVFYRDPKTLAIVRPVGLITNINSGMSTFQFPDDPRQYIVETIWPEKFLSPTVSGSARRLWLFPNEWGSWCSMNEHGIVP